jgi:hypothetical protein
VVGSSDSMEFKLGLFVGIFMVFHGAHKEQSGVNIGEEKWVGMVVEEAIMNYQFEFDPFDKEAMEDLEYEVRHR